VALSADAAIAVVERRRKWRSRGLIGFFLLVRGRYAEAG
jgi:hypothetical protein